MQWCGTCQVGFVLFIPTNVSEEQSLYERIISCCKLRPEYLQNLLQICKPSTFPCLTDWCVPMGTFFSVTTMKQFCLAAWKRHPSWLGMCGELLCQWQCWLTLLEGDSVIPATGQGRGGSGNNKGRVLFPGTQRYFIKGVSFEK